MDSNGKAPDAPTAPPLAGRVDFALPAAEGLQLIGWCAAPGELGIEVELPGFPSTAASRVRRYARDDVARHLGRGTVDGERLGFIANVALPGAASPRLELAVRMSAGSSACRATALFLDAVPESLREPLAVQLRLAGEVVAEAEKPSQVLAALRGGLRAAAALALLVFESRAERSVRLAPLAQLEFLGEGRWRSTGSDPQFVALAVLSELPRGWCRFKVRLGGRDVRDVAKLYLDTGRGFGEAQRVLFESQPGTDERSAVVYCPISLRRLRWDPVESAGDFTMGELRVEPLGLVRNAVLTARALVNRVRAAASLMKRRVLGAPPAGAGTNLPYSTFARRIDPLPEDLKHLDALKDGPRFSIVMPTYETDPKLLDAAVQSVRAQIYPRWELCIADDASSRAETREALAALARGDERIRLARRNENGGIAAASNDALALATGDFVVFLDHDDTLPPWALAYAAEALSRKPDTDLLYSDEDKLSPSGERVEPHFKPEWNPELFQSVNYLGHLVAMRRSLVTELGGLRAGFDGSQDYDLLLRATARVAPARIHHVPAVLYHWRINAGSTAAALGAKSGAHPAGLKALADNVAQIPGAIVTDGPFPTSYRVRYPVRAPHPRVSIVVPTRDGGEALEACVKSLRACGSYRPQELLIVDNQSRDPRTLAAFDAFAKQPDTRVLRYDAPFNFSAINNFAVEQAAGEIVLLLNDDVEVLTPGWLEEMVSRLQQPQVGAVGAKLYYPDGRVQHAGVVLGIGGVAGHAHKYFPRASAGYFGRLVLPQRVSAVTGACLMTWRHLYRELGGLDETNLAVAFNDVDYCLRLGERGWHCVFTPYVELVHHESLSRGSEDTPERAERFAREVRYMQARWGDTLKNDPNYSRYLSMTHEDFSFNAAATPYRPWLEEARA